MSGPAGAGGIEPTPSLVPGADAPEPGPFRRERGFGVATYLGLAITEAGDGTGASPTLHGTFAAPDHLTEDGRTPTGVLAALVDSIGGMASGLASLPDWIVTTNLTLRRAPSSPGSAPVGPLAFATGVLRRGRSSVVSRTRVTAEGGAAVATGWMTCAVLTPAGGPPEIERPVRPIEVPPVADPAFAGPAHAFFDLRAGTRLGEVSLELADRTRNPWGILHGGAVAVLLDAAACTLVAGVPADQPAPGPVVTDLVVHYLSPGRVGPVSATAEVVGTRGAESLVRVSVRDHGADDRPMALAVATVRHADRGGATVR